MKVNIHEAITSQILDELKKGVQPWGRNWKSQLTMPRNAVTGRAYSGINVLISWLARFEHNQWLTFNQLRKAGFKLAKGSKHTKFVHYSMVTINEGEDNEKTYPKVTYWRLFNVAQLEDWEPKEVPEHKVKTTAQELAKNIGADVRVDGCDPCYVPSRDIIRMPQSGAFDSAEDFDSVLLHELTHWTGHKSRLNRIGKEWTKEEYAFEELVAELGSAFMGAQLGMNYENKGHASYINHWIKLLEDDHKKLFKASSLASKACEFLTKGLN